MNNFLDNGAVLPFGLLGESDQEMMGGFNKTYRNFPLRIGVVTNTYPVDDEKNSSKLTNEYDVLVFEQNEDRGATTLTYRNCINSESFGSIADFFESTIRSMEKKTSKGEALQMKDQNGAIVLLLCLDAMSEKAIIIKSLTHPNRKTTLKDKGPRLEGEFNGINVKIEKDGSTTFTFKGATDNDGKVIDKEQGDTVLAVEKDGTYQVKHKTITQRFEKKGKASLTADDDISNTTKKNFLVTATENITLTATKDFNAKADKIIMNASGSAMLECQKLEVKAQSEISFNGGQFKVEAESMAKIKAATITLDGMVALGGEGGQPVLLLSTMMIGTGNLGAPVISQAISGYAVKVTAT